MYLGGEYSFVNMARPIIGDPQWVNQVLLCEFKIQEDVEMCMKLPDYDDFLGVGVPNETDFAAILKRIYDGFA